MKLALSSRRKLPGRFTISDGKASQQTYGLAFSLYPQAYDY
jgi:hypothetical protein